MLQVELISHSPNPEQTVAAAARLCYAAADIETIRNSLTPEKVQGFLRMLMSVGHESPVEHVSFTFGIEGVSRALLAQITRHRIASYSVQSQRYVRAGSFGYVTPPEVARNPQAKAVFDKAMAEAQKAYDTLAELLADQAAETLMAQGVPEKEARNKAQKAANEDARFVLPNACETKMLVTMNVRSLYHFFRLRCCRRAQWEIRNLAGEMLRLASSVAPTLFLAAGPACVTGGCSEGKMTCGHPEEVRTYIASLKKPPRASNEKQEVGNADG